MITITLNHYDFTVSSANGKNVQKTSNFDTLYSKVKTNKAFKDLYQKGVITIVNNMVGFWGAYYQEKLIEAFNYEN